ncbi:MAG: hypothetical protein ABF449_13125 [Ethanoligenens sp.]
MDALFGMLEQMLETAKAKKLLPNDFYGLFSLLRDAYDMLVPRPEELYIKIRKLEKITARVLAHTENHEAVCSNE